MKTGKIVKEFAPTATNRRNSEGAFIRMSNGAIAFAYTRYRAGSEDGEGADIAVSFSFDEGETFGQEKIAFCYEDCNADNIMSVSLLDLGDGVIGVYYLKKSKGLLCQLCLRKTKDFVVFSEEKLCTSDNAYFVVNNDRVRRLKDGRVVFPASYYDVSSKPADVDNHNYHSSKWRMPPSSVWVYSSVDGENFDVIAKIDNPFEILNVGGDCGLQEPGIVECDGFLYIYIRNMSGRQLECKSTDGGYTWTTPTLSRFTSPPSPMSTLLMSNGDILVGYNPVPFYWGRHAKLDNWTGMRTPYVLEIANPDMTQKTTPFAIESDEKSGYCYCAMFETKDGILLGYCAGSSNDQGGCLTRLRIRKIASQDLY